MRRLFRDRNFRLLAIGQSLNAFGDHAMFLALGIWIKTLTGSNAAAGLVALPFAAPSLVGPAFGVMIDRFPRRWVLAVTDVLAAGAIALLLFVNARGDVWLIYVVAFLYGTSAQVYQSARSGLLTSMLDEDVLGDANGFLQASNQGMRLIAPLVGATLFALAGGHAVALLDAGTFLASVAFLVMLRPNDLARRREPVRFLVELRDGARHLWDTIEIRRLTVTTAVVLMLIGTTEVAIYAMIDHGLHRAPTFLGVIAPFQGAGAIAMGLLAGTFLRKLGDERAVAAALLAAGLALALFGSGVLVLAFAGAFAFGIANSLYMAGYMTIVQRITPVELQGRVFSAVEAFITAPFVLSLALGGVLVSLVDFRVIYGASALGMLSAGAWLWRQLGPSTDTIVLEDAAAMDDSLPAA